MRHRLFLLLFLCAALNAGAGTVLFNDSFTLASGSPQVFDRSFAVNATDTCDGRARYFITVVTGDSTGKHAISSGVITLNGAALLREQDFRNAPHTITLQVTPAATNALHVEVKGGAPGSVLGVAVTREIETPVLTKTYTATKGESTFIETLTVDAGAQYALLVQNGATDGTGALQSVTVRLNRMAVLSQQVCVLAGRSPCRCSSLAPQRNSPRPHAVPTVASPSHSSRSWTNASASPSACRLPRRQTAQR